jgi:hypothetical protein
VFRMQASGVISGKIVDADGDPMAGVGVTATIAGTQSPMARRYSPGASGTTNDLGEYRIADLRPGKYVVTAQPSERGQRGLERRATRSADGAIEPTD